MDEREEAHRELDRLQDIITRHEGHMFTLRGWLLTVVGGLLAAYYTNNIEMSDAALRAALVAFTLLFLVVESRHENLVEAVVERVAALEKLVAVFRDSKGWYDGPKVSDACEDGAHRLWPKNGMTFVLNKPFYLVVILIIAVATISLPAKSSAEALKLPAAQCDRN